MRTWESLQRRIFHIDLHIVDENGGIYSKPPYLFLLLNQTTLLEGLVLRNTVHVPFLILMNIEYALLPLVGWVPWLLGSIVIVRNWKEQAKKGVVKAIEKMKRGDNIYMSIEGTRKPSETLHPYKKGAAVLAIRSQATIVPIIVKDAYRLMPYGDWRIRPGRVTVVLKKMIETSSYTIDDRDRLTQELRDVALQELSKKSS